MNKPLTRDELREHLQLVIDQADTVVALLRKLRDGPMYDENYKIECWGAQLTQERLVQAQQQAEALVSTALALSACEVLVTVPDAG